MSEFTLIGEKTVDDLRCLLEGSHLQDPTGVLSWLEVHADAIEFSTMPSLSAIACAIKLKPQYGYLLCEANRILPECTAVDAIPGLLTLAIQRYIRSTTPVGGFIQTGNRKLLELAYRANKATLETQSAG
ncbi:hypothetical protein MLDJOKPK_00174 [Salmonella phage SPAsTU]|nr:hypothetical protein MLDJOKPK_00174 [Salmonella phage SPAsTU]